MIDPTLLVSPAVKEIAALARERLTKRLDKATPSWASVFERLEDYVGEVLRWSSRIQFFGMPEAEDTETATINLKLSLQPRRFRNASSSASATIGESELLASPQHYVVLGEPGSGKSTTVKRLVRAVLLDEPSDPEDIYRYPVVIRLREHVSATDPDVVLATTVGIAHTCVDEGKDVSSAMVGDERLSDVVPRFLNEANAILMLDGLDELPENTRHQFEDWIVRLSYRLDGSKILVTSRSGDYYRHLDGFNLLELCPLDPEQARAIAQKWLTNADEFFTALEALPYRDIADRPLLLSQLIVLFRREGVLPEQPSHVYRRLLRLLLEDWDKERGITRSSRYAGFDADRKADFLAALSYHLTYKYQRSSFTLWDLASVYSYIHRLFGLPQAQAREVSEEIASHSGLIVASGSGYEFSHLSFQEYLCATHIVREPFPEHLDRYVATYPGPLAVAVAISASPANWFTGLILKDTHFRSFSPETLHSFLARLKTERPLFDVSAGLGIAVMRLFYESRKHHLLRQELRFLFEDDAVLESIARALGFYEIRPNEKYRSGDMIFYARGELVSRFQYQTPETVALPEAVVVRIIKKRMASVKVAGESGQTLTLNSQGVLEYPPEDG